MLICSTLLLLITYSSITYAYDEFCDESVLCSNVFDPVCGMTKLLDDTRIIRKYQNICHLNKATCRQKFILGPHQVPNKLCNIKNVNIESYSGRRIQDFGIVGAHQACNHTCPTYCIDTYEPACAQIFRVGMKKGYTYRPMINHCHIDLFSCALAVNVTIHPLGKCYKNPGTLMFMSQVAALKSMQLLGDDDVEGAGDLRNGKRHPLKQPLTFHK